MTAELRVRALFLRAVVMHLTSYVFASWQSWKVLLIPALLVYLLLVHLLRDRRAKSLEKRFSSAGRASFCHLTTNDAQIILKDLTELEFPKLFGFSIIFALFKAGSPILFGGKNKCSQIRPTSADNKASDVRNTERLFPSRCYRTACKYRDGIKTNCRHWGTAARICAQ